MIIIKEENTKAKREALKGYSIMVSNVDIHQIIAFRFDNIKTGTEKQIAYAKSIMNNKVYKVNEITRNMMVGGKMTVKEYEKGIESLINELDNFTDAKYIIENVK